MSAKDMLTAVPSYLHFIESSQKFVFQNYFWLKNEYNFPMDTISDLHKCRTTISSKDVILILVLAIVWTAFRYAATELLFKPFARLCRLSKKDVEKYPESAWKFFFYLSTFILTIYIILSQTNYFVRTDLIWKNYSMNDNIPQNIRILYLIEISFYVHSIYAVLFLDEWRKDSLVMFFHHIITVSLLLLSLATKAHRVGVLVLLLHDGCDVFMEATKCLLAFKTTGLLSKVIQVLQAIGFLSFMSSWAVCRLYWFPLKAIYSCSEYFGQNSIKFPFMLVLYSMLWLILLMDIYWFSFIVKILVNIITGQKREIEDNREYSPESLQNGKQQKRVTNGLNKKVK